MAKPFAKSPEFRRLLASSDGGSDVDLVRIGFEIAADVYPELDPAPYLDRLETLTERVRQRCAQAGQPLRTLHQLNWVLFEEEGFHGNTRDYLDPRNSYLNEVLDRRTGIPITLAVIYWWIAERLGVSLHGVNLPAHFVLGLPTDAGSSRFIDVFHGGRVLDRDGCSDLLERVTGRSIALQDHQFGPCSRADVVARMLVNLKSVYLRADDLPSVLPVQRRLAALHRDDPIEQRDLGILLIHLDRPSEAIEPLEAYLETVPTPSDADDLRLLLRGARREAAERN